MQDKDNDAIHLQQMVHVFSIWLQNVVMGHIANGRANATFLILMKNPFIIPSNIKQPTVLREIDALRASSVSMHIKQTIFEN